MTGSGNLMVLAVRWGFSNPLGLAPWLALALIPIAIVLLYFLKLRRRSIQVPSTLLWRRSIEDLHVNSLFQRLRKNLLLFLQLLAVALVLLAISGPFVVGLTSEGQQRLVIAIDESASMGATDVKPTRLDEAKQEARKIIKSMRSGDLAMLVAFSSDARVLSSYTSDKDLLLNRLDSITPTDGQTSVREALQLVAGLANPQKSVDVAEGQVAEDVRAPRLFLITDGGFADVEGFSLGVIQPNVIPIGPAPAIRPETTAADTGQLKIEPSDNLAILALQSARNDDDHELVQIFGRVRNHRAQAVTVDANLYKLDYSKPEVAGKLVDAVALELPPRGDQSFEFDLRTDPKTNLYEVRIDANDALAIDDRASIVLGSGRRARVLLVTTGNRFLLDTLRTQVAAQLCDVTEIKPDELALPNIANELGAGSYDLIVFDHARPERAPQANTLYFGAWPPSVDVTKTREINNPVILDWNMGHPLLQYIRDLNSIIINKAMTVELPAGANALIESDKGPVAFAIPREGYVDVVLGFELLRGREFNTNWTLKSSFPLFIYNSLRVLGRARTTSDDASTQPGQTVTLRPSTVAARCEIVDPAGHRIEEVERNTQGVFVATRTRKSGIYRARWGSGPDDQQAFAVNLFDARESDLSTRGQVPSGITGEAADAYKIKIGHSPVDAKRIDAPAQQDWWWPLTLLALGVVVVEWVVYNKRVFV